MSFLCAVLRPRGPLLPVASVASGRGSAPKKTWVGAQKGNLFSCGRSHRRARRMLLLACLLPAHLVAQDELAIDRHLTPAPLDRSSPSGPTSSQLLNAEVKHETRNETVCPVCGTNGTETAKNCCAPGGTWHGTCAAGEHEAQHTFQEGLDACHCENHVVCRLRRDLDRAVTQLDAAKGGEAPDTTQAGAGGAGQARGGAVGRGNTDPMRGPHVGRTHMTAT